MHLRARCKSASQVGPARRGVKPGLGWCIAQATQGLLCDRQFLGAREWGQEALALVEAAPAQAISVQGDSDGQIGSRRGQRETWLQEGRKARSDIRSAAELHTHESRSQLTSVLENRRAAVEAQRSRYAARALQCHRAAQGDGACRACVGNRLAAIEAQGTQALSLCNELIAGGAGGRVDTRSEIVGGGVNRHAALIVSARPRLPGIPFPGF